jgi:MATE family multidrug resistance protein
LLIQKESSNESEEDDGIWSDVKDTFFLGIPIFLSMLSWTAMKTTDSALLGHVSADALAAAALSDLWTMSTGVLIQGRVLGILVGAAVGAGNPKLGGIYLQVSLVILGSILFVVFGCWWVTERVWLAFGSDPTIAHMAGFYARVLAFSLPAQLVFSQISQFFSSQKIMHPEVNATAAAVAANLILGLVFVLGIPVPGWRGFGFAACPVVTLLVVYVQLLVMWYVYIHKKRLHEPCWDGWSLREITWSRIRVFCELYIPAGKETM